MAEVLPDGAALVPATASPANLLAPLTDPAGGPIQARLAAFVRQPAVKKAVPWFLGTAALGGAALAWSTLAPAPQRVLYAQLDDAERASIVSTLDKGGIHYRIDNNTGSLSVDEADLYKARMLVAQNGSLALPDQSGDGLDKLPMGASRALEGERLRAAREHDLMLTIKEIDGVQGVRVHLAEGEKSVFVRDTIPPSASVMLHLAEGRQLSQSQVAAIVNLVAGSVPGLSPDAVKVVDQHGRLMTEKNSPDTDNLELQGRMEDKLQGQVAALLTPMLGEGNFSSEIQVELDMAQVTSARESYDKQGAVRSETQQQSQQSGPGQAMGVPGVLSNTPPPATQASPGAPQGSPGATPSASPSPGAPASPTVTGESSASRQYELGREVAVSSQGPGKVKRLSVAVALSAGAMKKFKQADIDQIKSLVSAAVGADPARGDQVAVVVRGFDAVTPDKIPFYEAPWFAMVLRYGGALLAVLMVLLLGVRPLVKAVRGDMAAKARLAEQAADQARAAQEEAKAATRLAEQQTLVPLDKLTDPKTGSVDAEMLGRQVNIAQRLAEEKPDNAVIALRQMLQPPAGEPA